MCGIAGAYDFGGKDSHTLADTVSRMTDTMAHRGPNARGTWRMDGHGVHLGHRRLSIIDLSEAANQPMVSGCGRYIMVFNGEIYNYKKLRTLLEGKGHTFRTQSDTEVFIEGYKEYGLLFFEGIDGMFAAAIYDTETRQLVLARDSAGEKPLFYGVVNGTLYFASELQSFAKIPDASLQISETAFALYTLFRYVPHPYSILENIHKLEPGCYIEVDASGRMTHGRFFAFNVNPSHNTSDADFREHLSTLEDALLASVSRRMISDVPVGMFLSGGIDSSLVCAMAAQLTPKIRTFSVGFDNYDKSEHLTARAIAQRIGSEHHEIIVDASLFSSLASKIGAMMSEPNGDRSCIPTFVVSALAKKHVTVALSGDGGDELFIGYSRYPMKRSLTNGQFFQTPHQIDRLLHYLNHQLPVFGTQILAHASAETVDAISSFLEPLATSFMNSHVHPAHSMRELDFHTYLPGAVLSKVDMMSMRNSLEVRSPFLARNIYEIASELSVHFAIQNGFGKHPLRCLVEKHLGADIAGLPKLGFGTPPAFFEKNKQVLQSQLERAIGILMESRFFSGHPQYIPVLADYPHNANSAWATIALAQWMEAFPVRL